MENDLIKLGGNLENPRDCKPSDFPEIGPTGPAGSSSGDGQLVKQTFNQEGPRHSQDDGEAEWTVGVSKGEGGSPSTAIKISASVDLDSGEHYC
jgi:hypothetical protein